MSSTYKIFKGNPIQRIAFRNFRRRKILNLSSTNLNFSIKRPPCKGRRYSCVDKRNEVKLSSKDIVATAHRAHIPKIGTWSTITHVPFFPFGVKALIYLHHFGISNFPNSHCIFPLSIPYKYIILN